MHGAGWQDRAGDAEAVGGNHEDCIRAWRKFVRQTPQSRGLYDFGPRYCLAAENVVAANELGSKAIGRRSVDFTCAADLSCLIRLPLARIAQSKLKELVVTNTILATEAVKIAPNIRELNLAPLIAEAMRDLTAEQSVSSLFD